MSLRGFTWLELLSVMIVLSLLTVSFWAPEMQSRVKDFKRARVDVMVEEIRRIGTAAQGFALDHNGHWPDQAEHCIQSDNAVSSSGLDLESPLYLGAAGAAQTMPFSVPSKSSAKLGYYYFYCAEKPPGSGRYPEFTLRFALGGNDRHWRHYIATQFAGSVVLDHGDYPGLAVSWPLPAAVPLFDAFLPKDGSSAMRGDLDMGSNTLHKVKNVFLETGQSLASVPLLHSIARPGNQIVKPACPELYQPQIMVTPSEIAHDSGAAVSQFRVWAMDGGAAWTIKSRVITEAGVQDDDNAHKILVGVTVKCVI